MATLLYDKPDSGAATTFVLRLLNFAVTAHMHHLATTSYAQHMALGGLYEGLPGLVDSVAEAFMGCSGQRFAQQGDPIADVQAVYDYVEANRGKLGNESHIQNEVDNICNLLASTLYKLKNLT